MAKASPLPKPGRNTKATHSVSITAATAALAFALGWGGRRFHDAAAALATTAADFTAAAAAADTTAGDAGAGGAGAAAGHDPWRYTTHPTMGRDGFNWTQLSMSRAGNFPRNSAGRGGIREWSVADAEALGPMGVWHKSFARSIPARIDGLAKNWSDTLSRWSLSDFRAAWGHLPVVAAFSPDHMFQRGIGDARHGRRLLAPHRQRVGFGEFLDLVEADAARAAAGGGAPVEHVSVQQSPSGDLSEFGLPSLPPLIGEIAAHTMQARNFWAAAPPKVSVLHYDWQDSILLQLSGTKKFTIVDPARLPASYPCVQLMTQLVRRAPGVFDARETERELDNFPLVNVTHPDLARHPLFRDALENNGVFEVEVPEGAALLLPAYWHHQVESFAAPGQLNVAVNYWFQGHSLATRLYRTLRENVFINCTQTVSQTPGARDPCR